jgi:hypothetical protein
MSSQNILLVSAFVLAAITGAYLLAKEAGFLSAKMAEASNHSKDLDRAVPSRKGQVQGANLNQEDELQTCYESYLKRQPKVEEGVVEVHWMLDKGGRISSMELVRSDLEDQTFTHCLLEKIKKMTFHPPTVTRPTLVAHKFNFKRRTPASLSFKQANDTDSKNTDEE